jgi:hypothetical protein
LGQKIRLNPNPNQKFEIENPTSEIIKKSEIENPTSEIIKKSEIENPTFEIIKKSEIENPTFEIFKKSENRKSDIRHPNVPIVVNILDFNPYKLNNSF